MADHGTWEYSTEGELVAEQLEAAQTPPREKRRRVCLRFAWYDLWVGAYIDRSNRMLYICPLPTFLIEVRL